MEDLSAPKKKTSMMIWLRPILYLVSIPGTLMISWTTLYALAHYFQFGGFDWGLFYGILMLSALVICGTAPGGAGSTMAMPRVA